MNLESDGILPPDHPHRRLLNDEIHARPPDALNGPTRLSYLVLLGSGSMADDQNALKALLAGHDVAPPQPEDNHFSADLGAFRIKWERHTEFCRYTFSVPGVEADRFSQPALSKVPEAWLRNLKGQKIAAVHACIVRATAPLDHAALSQTAFAGNVVVGSSISGGNAQAFTDFKIHADGFERLLVYDLKMTPRQAGRMVQRIFEVNTYRMLGLLTLPVARKLSPFLTETERELIAVMSAMQNAGEAEEPELLDRLTRLEANAERQFIENQYRFAAAGAYADLVHKRIEELREERIEGLQTFREFNERRFLPAIATCRATSSRQKALSERIAHATMLLSTRVGVSRERQNQTLLQSMDRRADLQLRLQQTVEGLSVAAIAYYIVGLSTQPRRVFCLHSRLLPQSSSLHSPFRSQFLP